MKLQDYKGYEIFVGTDGKFEAKKEGTTELVDDRLADLKEKIDRFEEKRIRQPVLIQAYMNKIVKGELISVVEYGIGPTSWEAWVTWKEGGSIRRERINYSLLIRNTEKNIRLAREINELYKRRRKLYKQCNDLNSKIYALQDKLEHLSAKDIGYGDQR